MLSLYRADEQLRRASSELAAAIELRLRSQLATLLGRVHPMAHLGVPLWQAAETMSFRMLRQLYLFAPNRLREQIAAEFSCTPRELRSWLVVTEQIRHRAVHHQRMWDTGGRPAPYLQRRRHDFVLNHLHEDDSSCYTALAIMAYLAKSIGQERLVCGAKEALSAFDRISVVDPQRLGTPPGWSRSALWHICPIAETAGISSRRPVPASPEASATCQCHTVRSRA